MLRGDYDQHMREAWVWMCGRFVPYPFQNNIHRLPPTSSSNASWGSSSRKETTLPREQFAQWITAIFGDGIARHFMRSNYSPQVTPGPDHFSLLAEVSASPYKHENADDVIERTIEGMVASELLTPAQAADKIVSKQLLQVPYSYPVPTIGRDRALAVIQPWLMSHDIYSRGRFGAWRYEIGNTDHSVMMGVELADHLVDGAPETTWALLPGEEARATIS